MKKILATAMVLISVLAIAGTAIGEKTFSIVSPTRTVTVNGQVRFLQVSYEKDGASMYMVYRFFGDAACTQFLGEEWFDKDGTKVSDSYLENNGDWRDGYQKAYR